MHIVLEGDMTKIDAKLREMLWQKEENKSAASASSWLSKAHYQVVLHTFSSFPSSLVQMHLCVWEREQERKRARSSHRADVQNYCISVSDLGERVETPNTHPHDTICLFWCEDLYVLLFV